MRGSVWFAFCPNQTDPRTTVAPTPCKSDRDWPSQIQPNATVITGLIMPSIATAPGSSLAPAYRTIQRRSQQCRLVPAMLRACRGEDSGELIHKSVTRPTSTCLIKE